MGLNRFLRGGVTVGLVVALVVFLIVGSVECHEQGGGVGGNVSQNGRRNEKDTGGGSKQGSAEEPVVAYEKFEEAKTGTELTTDPFRNLLVVSTLDGTLTAVDRISGELRWISKDDKPMINVPSSSAEPTGTLPKAPYFLPDPKTGSLYVMGKQNSLRKLPFTIPQLVAMAPCRNSEGLMYTGRKMDVWLMLNPFTGEKSEIPADGSDATCPAWSSDNPSGAAGAHSSESDSCSADSAAGVRKRLVKSLLIGKTEYTLSMMDGPRKWNVTYNLYSSKDMNQQSLQDYELVHFTSPSQGSLTTYDRASGDLLWQRELESPVIAMYTIDGTSTNLVSVPFNPIASDTLNRLKSTVAGTTAEKPLSPTTYVGECAYGIYATPALADENVLMISAGSKLPPLLEGPVAPAPEPLSSASNQATSSQEDYLLLGYYQINDPSTASTSAPVGTGTTNDPARQIESESEFGPQKHNPIPAGAFNESGFLEDGKVINIDDTGHEGDINGIKVDLSMSDNDKKQQQSSPKPPSTPNIVQFPPPLLARAKKVVGKEEIKIVFTTAIISILLTSFVLGVVFFAYRRYKNEQLALQHKLLSSDSGLHLIANTGDSSTGGSGSNVSGSGGRLSNTSITGIQAITRQDSVEGTELIIGKISLYPSQVLGKGCEGTFVFKGKFEGRDVAVKRILPECFQFADREVDLLKESDQHPNVIRYFCTETDGQFRYIALELCIATLHDWVEGKYSHESIIPCDVLREASEGLAHLHTLRIVHRDVKPANVLLSLCPASGRVRTTISDFGLCKKLQNGRMSFSRRSGGIPGTDGWIAPEVVRNIESQPERMTYSVDIFSMGCVFYYVLTGGQHPFGDPFRRQSNILNGEYDLEKISTNPQGALELIRVMISSNPNERPPLSAILTHPIFWSKDKILSFFLDVSDRIEKESEDTFPLLRRLEQGATPVVRDDWRDHICSEVAMDLRKYRTYKGHSIRDLLRALRNKKNHYRELTLEAQTSLGHIPDQFVQYWISRFPLLLPYTWTRFEALKEEPVFFKYYPKDYEFFEVLISAEELGTWGENLVLGEEDGSSEGANGAGQQLLEGGIGRGKKLDKDFWKSKSHAKYQRWRRGGGAGGGGSPRRNPPQITTPDNNSANAKSELSASTDNYWRNPSPGRSPTRNNKY